MIRYLRGQNIDRRLRNGEKSVMLELPTRLDLTITDEIRDHLFLVKKLSARKKTDLNFFCNSIVLNCNVISHWLSE